jgi:hypothetical protein
MERIHGTDFRSGNAVAVVDGDVLRLIAELGDFGNLGLPGRASLEPVPESTAAELVTAFLHAKPRQQHRLNISLIQAVLADPTVGNLLPLPWTLPEGAPRFAVGQLRLLALRELGDVLGLRAYLAAAPTPSFRYGAGFQFGNSGKKAKRLPFAPVLASLLIDDDAAVRYAGLYFFSQLACKEEAELSPWAYELVRLTSDPTRPPKMKEFISSEARATLGFALRYTQAREHFVEAGKKWLLECDAKQRRLFLKAAAELLPELLEKK